MADDVLAIEARLKDYISGSLAQLETNVKKFSGTTKQSFKDIEETTKKTGGGFDFFKGKLTGSLAQLETNVKKFSTEAVTSFKKVGDETKRANDDISKALRKQFNETTDSVKKSNDSFSILGVSLKTIAIGAIAVKAATMAMSWGMQEFNKALAVADKLDKLNKQFGVTTDELQRLDYVARQSGGSVENFGQGFRTLATNAREASMGTKEAVESFAALGINVLDNNGKLKKITPLFNEVVTKLQGVSNETERAALAQKVFGRSATEMLPIINMSSKELESMKKEAEKLGQVMSDENVKKLDNFGDSLNNLGKAVTNLTAHIISPWIDDLTSLLDKANKVAGVMSKLSPQLAMAAIVSPEVRIRVAQQVKDMEELAAARAAVSRAEHAGDAVAGAGIKPPPVSELKSGFRRAPNGGAVENVPLWTMAAENRDKFYSEKEKADNEAYNKEYEIRKKADEAQAEFMAQLLTDTNEELKLQQTKTKKEEEESKKRIRQSQLERDSKVNMLVSFSSAMNRSVNDMIALSKKHGNEGKKVAIAQATINAAMAQGGAAASIWGTPGGLWQEKLIESILISGSLWADYGVQLAAINQQQFANGTRFAGGGMSLVGEQGPELVDIPRGSRVYTHNETKNMMGGNTININIPLGTSVDMRAASSIRESAKYIGEVLMQAEYEGRLEKVKAVLR